MHTRVLVLLGLAVVACSSSRHATHPAGAPPAQPSSLPASGAPQPGGDRQPVTDVLRTTSSGATDQVRLVVRDPVQWVQLWEHLTRDRLPPPAAPRIDFSGHVVVVAAMGSRRTTGHAATIDSVVQEWRLVRVHVRSTEPGRGCVVGAGFTSPVHVVRIPRTHPVVFSEIEERQPECRWGSPAP